MALLTDFLLRSKDDKHNEEKMKHWLQQVLVASGAGGRDWTLGTLLYICTKAGAEGILFPHLPKALNVSGNYENWNWQWIKS